MSIEGYNMYSDHAIPILSPIQRGGGDSKIVFKKSGRGRGNYLWINFDET